LHAGGHESRLYLMKRKMSHGNKTIIHEHLIMTFYWCRNNEGASEGLMELGLGVHTNNYLLLSSLDILLLLFYNSTSNKRET